MSPDDWTVATGLALIALVLSWALWSAVSDRRARRRRELQAAMRRHPSARTTMSDAERRYHGSDQIGR